MHVGSPTPDPLIPPTASARLQNGHVGSPTPGRPFQPRPHEATRNISFMAGVTFRQTSTRGMFTVLFVGGSIAFASVSVWEITDSRINTGLSAPTVDIGFVLVIALSCAVLAVRAWRQCVVLDGQILRIRRIFSTREVPIEEISRFGLFKNLPRNAWLGGVETQSGQIFKFPFWANSWIRNDPRNESTITFLSSIESMVIQRRSDSSMAPGASQVIEYWR